ncbi:MAG: hypothetical protein MUO53_15140 [Maribacter sp.]|nr:hypothetical protein [Maribacter sp.]
MQKYVRLPIIILSIVLLNLSCRKEEFVSIPGPDQQPLANTTVADLLERTALNDGSIDNIIDKSNCFTVQLPVTVKVNGSDLLISSDEDFANIEAIFDAFDDDSDVLEIRFPITIFLSDFTEVAIADLTEFNSYSASCNGENIVDDDIECLDIQYPITATIFNQVTEVFDTISITSDWQLYIFIDDLKSDDIVDIGFPIVVILADGTQVSVVNLIELERVIDDAKDSCDEDDDYDYNDDDCDNCTTNQLADLLTGCTNWIVDKLERHDNKLEDNYIGYQFNFATDGTMSAANNGNSFSGTWESAGTGNNIYVTINIPNLSDFNATWNLHEIEQSGSESNIDLRLGGNDRLRFKSNCSDNGGNGNGNGNTGTLATILADGLWVVGSYTEDSDDQTSNYNGYTLNFNSDGTVVASNGTAINGTWAAQNSDNELFIDFGNTTTPFDKFNDTWDIISVTDTQVELRDVSGGNGGTDSLILSKQ